MIFENWLKSALKSMQKFKQKLYHGKLYRGGTTLLFSTFDKTQQLWSYRPLKICLNTRYTRCGARCGARHAM